MWDALKILFGAVSGFLFATVLAVLVMPKIHSECKLPMPALPSYLLGHVTEFLDIRYLLQKNMAWFRDLGDVFQIWIVHKRAIVTANPEDVAQILGKPHLFARPKAQTVLFNDLQPENFQTMPREIHKKHRQTPPRCILREESGGYGRDRDARRSKSCRATEDGNGAEPGRSNKPHPAPLRHDILSVARGCSGKQNELRETETLRQGVQRVAHRFAL